MKPLFAAALVAVLALGALSAALWWHAHDDRDGERRSARPTRRADAQTQRDSALDSMLAELVRTPVEPIADDAELDDAGENVEAKPRPAPDSVASLVLAEREPNLSRVAYLQGEFLRGEWPAGGAKFEAHQRRDEDGVWTLEGPWRAWYPNGTLEELGGYRGDREHGEWLWWYANGAEMARGAFEDGERVGVWTFWHPSGVVIGEGPYVAGLRSGRWTFRFADGSPHSDFSGLYEEGERVGP
jgi:hypothetical protein